MCDGIPVQQTILAFGHMWRLLRKAESQSVVLLIDSSYWWRIRKQLQHFHGIAAVAGVDRIVSARAGRDGHLTAGTVSDCDEEQHISLACPYALHVLRAA